MTQCPQAWCKLGNERYWPRKADVGPRSARTTDHKEAVRAFIDKRKPAFVGQFVFVACACECCCIV